MAIGADLDLQRGMVTKLKNSSELQALIGDPIRLFQDVPPPETLTFPYCTIGQSQTIEDDAECIIGYVIFPDVHVYTRAPGYELVKRIGATIKEAIHLSSLSLAEHRCLEIRFAGDRYFRDQDNNTKHGVISFRAMVELAD